MDGEWLRRVSAPRCNVYLGACGGDPALALSLYEWNLDVASAFHRPLHYLEIVVRNAIHDRLSAHFGQKDWWQVVEGRLQKHARETIHRVREEREDKYGFATPDGIVSNLPLGFWVGLVSKRNNYEMTFWRPCLHKAFPGYHGKQTYLHKTLDSMRLFRNEISHHEPIHHRHLGKDFDTICELIGFVSEEMADYVGAHAGVPDVLARRPPGTQGRRP